VTFVLIIINIIIVISQGAWVAQSGDRVPDFYNDSVRYARELVTRSAPALHEFRAFQKEYGLQIWDFERLDIWSHVKIFNKWVHRKCATAFYSLCVCFYSQYGLY
jgi:hypothetical protein